MLDLDILVGDWETYWAIDYTLKANKHCNLNTAQYVRDKRFKAHGIGLQFNDDDPVWVSHSEVPKYLKRFNWKKLAFLAHHTHFDGLILAERYGFYPAFYLDTLSMGRALHGAEVRSSLDSLAAFYRLGNKLPDVLNQTKGIRDLPPELEEKLALYCLVDIKLCRRLYDLMRGSFSNKELWLIDNTIRMYTQPSFGLDKKLVRRAAAQERKEKQRLLEAAGVDEDVLQSSAKLADKLTEYGVTPPEKWSQKQEDWTWAFAKTDFEFTELLNSDDERVRSLVRARLAVKSTIGERRAERLEKVGAPVPIYLNYCGAHTTRWSGGDKLNPQNFPRPEPDDPENTGLLRKSLKAPPGHKIVVFDSGQIEARILAWLAGQEDLLEAFRDPKRDPYCELASLFYGRTITKADKLERFIGKIGRLGLGYQMGAPKLRWTLAIGVMGPPVYLSLEECQKLVNVYRSNSKKIERFWSLALRMIEAMYKGDEYDFGPLHIQKNAVQLPSGLFLRYPKLGFEVDEMYGAQWSYYNKKKRTHIYGGAMTENLVQALSRCATGDWMYEIGQIYKLALMSHDEIVAVVPNRRVKSCMNFMHDVMVKDLAWAPGLPLAAAGGAFDYYGKPD